MLPELSRIERLHELIASSGRITTISHTHPDGDAVGSSLGLSSFLTALGKDVVSVFPDPIHHTLAFIPRGEKILIHSEEPGATEARLASSDLVICLDFNTPGRIEALGKVLAEADCPKVLIDHHPFPEESFFDLVFSETEVSSASELTYYILMSLPETGGDARRLPGSCARALMTGMTTDTNNFSNSVYPSTLSMASALLGAGVDREEILSCVLQSYRESRLRLLGYVLSEKMHLTPGGGAYFVLTAAELAGFDVQEGETEGFVNIPLQIASVRLSLFLREEGGLFRVSARSKRGTSAAGLCRKYFHGGGHEQASGGKLRFPDDIPSREAAEQYVEQILKEYLG